MTYSLAWYLSRLNKVRNRRNPRQTVERRKIIREMAEDCVKQSGEGVDETYLRLLEIFE